MSTITGRSLTPAGEPPLVAGAMGQTSFSLEKTARTRQCCKVTRAATGICRMEQKTSRVRNHTLLAGGREESNRPVRERG